jgi:hypothetical protein
VNTDHGRRGVVGVELPLHADSDDEKKDTVGEGGACEQSEEADSTETEFPPYGDIRSYCTASGRYGTKGSSELQRVL